MIFWGVLAIMAIMVGIFLSEAYQSIVILFLGILVGVGILLGGAMVSNKYIQKDIVFSYTEKIGIEKTIWLPGNTQIGYKTDTGRWKLTDLEDAKVVSSQGDLYLTYKKIHVYTPKKFYIMGIDHNESEINLEMK